MLVSKKNRLAVYSYLFKEGVMCAKKDFVKPKHDEVDVPNLEVIKLMTSLKSREYVTETFSWQWFYWYLTDAGIAYLREYMHLPEDIIPATHKKPATSAAGAGYMRGDAGGRGGGFGKDRGDKPRFGGEGGYRREGGGFGRGGGAPRGDAF